MGYSGILFSVIKMLFFKNYETELRELALKLFDIEAFKFGDFKMKVGDELSDLFS